MQGVSGGTTEGKVNIALKVLQGNLGRSSFAQDLLTETAFEGGVDLAIVSEQYLDMNNRGWYSDITSTAAFWVRNPRNWEGHVVMAGDFNAKALDWGMSWSCSRGTAVVEMAYRLDLSVLNDGVVTKFRRSDCQGTIIDITLASAGAAARIHDWRVMEDFNGIDHQHIKFMIEGSGNRRPSPVARASTCRWNVARLDDSALINTLNGAGHFCCEREPCGVTTRTDAESLTETSVTRSPRHAMLPCPDKH